MKKKLAIFMTTVLVISFAACGSQAGDQGSGSSEPTQSVQGSTQDSTQDNTRNEESTGQESDQQQGSTEGTMGQVLLEDFRTRAQAGETGDLQTLGESLLSNPVIGFKGGASLVETGYLQGFSKEIDGFREGVMFGPMMGSIAFVGYVFRLEDGADMDAFVQTLKDNADPRWQICVEANETVVDVYENTVFFVMCPTDLDM